MKKGPIQPYPHKFHVSISIRAFLKEVRMLYTL